MTETPTGNPATRGAGRPRDETVEYRVLPVVRQMLIDIGWNDLSMRAVAAQTGIGRATLLRRWPSKVELVLHAVLGETPDLAPFEGTDRRGWVDWVLRGSREFFARREVRAAVPGLLTALDRDEELRRRLWRGFSGPTAALFASDGATNREDTDLDARAILALGAGAALFLELIADSEAEAIHHRIARLLTDAIDNAETTQSDDLTS